MATEENKTQENLGEQAADKDSKIEALFKEAETAYEKEVREEQEALEAATAAAASASASEEESEETPAAEEETSEEEESTEEESSEEEDDPDKKKKKGEEDEEEEEPPKFFQTKEEMESELSQIAQKEYEARHVKEQVKGLEKENAAYKEIFERFQTNPLYMLREMYGPDVVEQLQKLEVDDKEGGLKQSTRAMQQRLEKLEAERKQEAEAREKEKEQASVQEQFQRYTGELSRLGDRKEFELARKYCKHQGLDLTKEASIYAGQLMQQNPDSFVEPIDALRGIQEYVEKVIKFDGKDKTEGTQEENDDETNTEEEGNDASAEDKTPAKKKKKTKPSTLTNKDGKVSGIEGKNVDTNPNSTASRHARVDKLFDEWERTQN